MNKTITLDRPIVETLTNFLGKLPVETGVAPLHAALFNALNAPVAPVETEAAAKKAMKKSARNRKPRGPKSSVLIAEFMLNNPLATAHDVQQFLISRGLSEASAKNAAAKHFSSK